MGFFSKFKDQAVTGLVTGGALFGTTDDIGNSPIQKEQREAAEAAVRQGQEAASLKREQFDVLRQDIAPLRELRDENINRLLRLQGIGQPQDTSDFNISPEFTTVRDAALSVQGGDPRQAAELAERANQLGQGEFGNFQNRVFNTAGFSSAGVGGTNRLLQENVDARTNILNRAGSQAAAGLVSGAQQRGQAAGGLLSLAGAFCDIRLKDNIELIGHYPCGLPKYQWDWTSKALDIVGDQINEGPIAQEAQAIMPGNVHLVNGYLAIKDMRLIDGH